MVRFHQEDNTNWKAGGPCFQMKNVNFWWAAQNGGPMSCRKEQPSGLPFPTAQLIYCAACQPVLMCSPLARPVLQPAGPPLCAACQPVENSCFSFSNAACWPSNYCYLTKSVARLLCVTVMLRFQIIRYAGRPVATA